MSTEIANTETQILLLKQEKEILELKFNLQKLQAEKSTRLEDSLLSPALYEHYQKISKMLAGTGVIPNAYKGKDGDIFVAMAMGYQLGFPVEQALQDIAVINGRPCLWGDGLLALCLSHPDCQSIKEEPIFDGKLVVGYTCTVVRRGHEPHTQQFTLRDAEQAKLLNKLGPWLTHPTRMLQMRARAFALRDKFADALRGLRIAEVEQDNHEVIEGTLSEEPKKQTQTQKLKEMLSIEDAQVSDEQEVKDIKANADDLDKIDILMTEKGFDDERKKKALAYFKVKKLDELKDSQAKLFMMQLEKA